MNTDTPKRFVSDMHKVLTELQDLGFNQIAISNNPNDTVLECEGTKITFDRYGNYFGRELV